MKCQSLDKAIFFIDLDNTLIESPYPKIFDGIVRDISTSTGKTSNSIWSQINKEFKSREEKKILFQLLIGMIFSLRFVKNWEVNGKDP